MSGDLESLIYSCIDRYMGGGSGQIGNARYHERHAIVTSYDPDKYLAKVMLMPEGQESGWLPIETGHIGSDYGHAVGLQPGDGKKTGDQVIIRMQEGDLESGKIVQRVHSDSDKPPRVESGEMVMWAKFKKSKGKSQIGDETTDQASGDDNDQADSGKGGSGQQFYFKNDGSTTWTDGNGATITKDGAGKITITSTNNDLVVNIQGNVAVTVQGNVDVTANGTATVTAPTVNTVGDTHLGSPGGVKAAKLGTIDTGGFADMLNLADLVKVT